MKKLLLILALLLLASIAINVFMLTRQPQVEIKRDTADVVRWDTIHDSLPPEKGEKVISYVTIPCHHDTTDAGNGNTQGDSLCDGSVTLPVVQKVYSDDSTYTAYVSGPKADSYPRLDSISVMQKIIERNITNTIIEEQHGLRLKIRPAVTAGYDPIHKTWGLMAGGSVVIDW